MSNNRTSAKACVVKFAIVLIFSSSVSFALGQSPSATVSSATVSSIEPPTFRPRTDSMAVQDLDAVRERLRSMTDSRGPINPLSEYGKPKPSKNESNSKVRKEIDDGEKDLEALKVPSLDADAQRRLKAQPPTVSPGELSVIGLYPPPRMTTNPVVGSSSFAVADDGFRPLVGISVSANYQISDSPFNDPAAMIPPSLGIPSGSVPSFNPPPIGSPATVLPPPSGAPLPSVGAPVAGAPVVSAPVVGAPGTGIVGGNILSAPPSYVVPTSPSNAFPPSNVFPPSNPMTTQPMSSAPYAPATPTYSREGTTINSLPFVSMPPKARDARWMVSPEVYRRMESNNACGPGTPVPVGSPTVANTASPFFYAPPAAMPMPTPYTAGRHSWLHPFRHFHHQ